MEWKPAAVRTLQALLSVIHMLLKFLPMSLGSCPWFFLSLGSTQSLLGCFTWLVLGLLSYSSSCSKRASPDESWFLSVILSHALWGVSPAAWFLKVVLLLALWEFFLLSLGSFLWFLLILLELFLTLDMILPYSSKKGLYGLSLSAVWMPIFTEKNHSTMNELFFCHWKCWTEWN